MSQTSSLHQPRTGKHHPPTESRKSFQSVITHFVRTSPSISSLATTISPEPSKFDFSQGAERVMKLTSPVLLTAWFVVKTMPPHVFNPLTFVLDQWNILGKCIRGSSFSHKSNNFTPNTNTQQHNSIKAKRQKTTAHQQQQHSNSSTETATTDTCWPQWETVQEQISSWFPFDTTFFASPDNGRWRRADTRGGDKMFPSQDNKPQTWNTAHAKNCKSKKKTPRSKTVTA